MAHVQLDANNTITGVFANPQDFSVEIVDTDPRLAAWNNKALLPQVNAFRDARLAAGFTDPASGKTFQCDDRSIMFYTALGAAAKFASITNKAGSFNLIAADNSVNTMSPAAVSALVDVMMTWVSATVLFARAMKNNILAGNPPSDITQGWP